MNDESWLEDLAVEDCLQLLRQTRVGRIGTVANGYPAVVPVNYRVVESQPGRMWLALRTRPGNAIDQVPMNVALEIDDIDPSHQEGWSVLVRGTLHRVDADAAGFRERFDPEPWILEERDAWLVIEPFMITGRRLHAREREWAFDDHAYI